MSDKAKAVESKIKSGEALQTILIEKSKAGYLLILELGHMAGKAGLSLEETKQYVQKNIFANMGKYEK